MVRSFAAAPLLLPLFLNPSHSYFDSLLSTLTAARPAVRGPPAWKVRARTAERKLGRQAEATLEMLWTRTEWPSDDVIQSMWDLHRVRRDVVIDWFKARRSVMRRGGGKGGGGEGGAGEGGEARPSGEAAEGEESGGEAGSEGEAFQ
jgi:hypothetical protein